jgi:SAM-dependent methyltransferase
MSAMTGSITRTIRESYDRVADEYARRIANELQHKPFDRALLDRFAAEVAGRGDVCDLGCGPGHVTRYLRVAGAAVFGLDLSPRMIDEARRLHPEIPFREGDMLALDLQTASLAGIAAFYAIVNIPRHVLGTAFGEMARVLQPGGVLLLAFHAGHATVHQTELWGRRVDMDFFFFDLPLIRAGLETAGFVLGDVLEREPYAPEVEYQSRRAYVFARTPGGPAPR